MPTDWTKVEKLIRLLDSDQDGEVLNAVAALKRMVEGGIPALAERVAKPPSPASVDRAPAGPDAGAWDWARNRPRRWGPESGSQFSQAASGVGGFNRGGRDETLRQAANRDTTIAAIRQVLRNNWSIEDRFPDRMNAWKQVMLAAVTARQAEALDPSAPMLVRPIDAGDLAAACQGLSLLASDASMSSLALARFRIVHTAASFLGLVGDTKEGDAQ